MGPTSEQGVGEMADVLTEAATSTQALDFQVTTVLYAVIDLRGSPSGCVEEALGKRKGKKK
jgi:hypothetical protein